LLAFVRHKQGGRQEDRFSTKYRPRQKPHLPVDRAVRHTKAGQESRELTSHRERRYWRFRRVVRPESVLNLPLLLGKRFMNGNAFIEMRTAIQSARSNASV